MRKFPCKYQADHKQRASHWQDKCKFPLRRRGSYSGKEHKGRYGESLPHKIPGSGVSRAPWHPGLGNQKGLSESAKPSPLPQSFPLPQPPPALSFSCFSGPQAPTGPWGVCPASPSLFSSIHSCSSSRASINPPCSRADADFGQRGREDAKSLRGPGRQTPMSVAGRAEEKGQRERGHHQEGPP